MPPKKYVSQIEVGNWGGGDMSEPTLLISISHEVLSTGLEELDQNVWTAD